LKRGNVAVVEVVVLIPGVNPVRIDRQNPQFYKRAWSGVRAPPYEPPLLFQRSKPRKRALVEVVVLAPS
jgi:hypothetical protein